MSETRSTTMTFLRSTLTAVLCLLMLAGCSTLSKYDPLEPAEMPTRQEMYDREMPRLGEEPLPALRKADTSAPLAGRLPRHNEGILHEGRFGGDLQTAGSKASSRAPRDTANLKEFAVNFDNVSLRTVVDFIFSTYLKAPYIIAPDFTERQVTWEANGRYTEEEILALFQMFMDTYGVKAVYNNGTYVLSSGTPKGVSSRGAALGQAIQAWQMRFLNATDIQAIIRQFVSDPALVQIIPQADTLVVTGSLEELRQINTFIERIDMADLGRKSIMIYGPRSISAQALAGLMQNLPTKMGFRPRDRSPAIEAEVIAGTNRVVIVTNSDELRDVVRQFIEEVDSAQSAAPQVFYYPLRNQNAEEVQQTLGKLLENMDLGASRVDVVVHGSTNSLLIRATPDQYYEVRKIIERIDYTVPSVMIDATILEVRLDDNLAYGVEWFLKKNGVMGSNRDVTINGNLANANIVSPPLELGLSSLNSSTTATIDLLASQTDLRVLSRPRLLVRNQATAKIKSTEKIRVLRSQFLTDVQQDNSSLPAQEFEVEEVGITLAVTPNIADDGTITMVVEIENSNQGPNDTSTGFSQPTFNVRQVTTELVVNDMQTVMIGGLIESTESLEKRKIPLLGDIPLLGKAFSNHTDTSSRSELIVLLTPYVVTGQTSAQMISEAFSGISLPKFRRQDPMVVKTRQQPPAAPTAHQPPPPQPQYTMPQRARITPPHPHHPAPQAAIPCIDCENLPPGVQPPQPLIPVPYAMPAPPVAAAPPPSAPLQDPFSEGGPTYFKQ